MRRHKNLQILIQNKLTYRSRDGLVELVKLQFVPGKRNRPKRDPFVEAIDERSHSKRLYERFP